MEQSSPAREWIAGRTEVLINHLRNCNFQPQDVHTKAQIHKDSTQSPKRPCYMMAEPEAGSSQRQSTSSPYPLPMLHVRTPSDSQQSAYTLTVSRPPSRASYEQESSIVSSSSSSLAPSDSIQYLCTQMLYHPALNAAGITSLLSLSLLMTYHGQMHARRALKISSHVSLR